MLTDFRCPSCKSSNVLGDAMLKYVLFVCQHCGTREIVKHRHEVAKPYYFISSDNPFISDMLGKN